MPIRRVYRLALCTMLAAACKGDSSERNAIEPGALSSRIVSRFPLQAIALDTLSDSAQIVGLFPEPNGDAVAFTFRDPVQGISQGLGILTQSRDTAARLGWPDSVSSVHWRRAHELVFTAGTGKGVYVILDVRADSLVTVKDTTSSADTVSTLPVVELPSPETRARITRMVDSIRFQPEGVPQQGQLRYLPTRILQAPHDSATAFYVAATDHSGIASNPTWYLLDQTTGSLTALDSVIGPASSLPGNTGAWANDSTFYFTKELTLLEVRVKRGGGVTN